MSIPNNEILHSPIISKKTFNLKKSPNSTRLSIFGKIFSKKLIKKNEETSSNKKESPVTILLNLDRKIYYPESKVNGVIYLKTNHVGIITKINLKIIGKEETRISKWVKETSIAAKIYLKKNPKAVKNDNSEISINEFDINYYIDHKFELYNNKRKKKILENVGYYKLYFTFNLPCFLPGSFKYEWMKEKLFLNYGIIRYYVIFF